MLAAARDLFGAQGYANTSTKQIAQRAGTVETILFRNFGSKADLFAAAVAAPFCEYIEGYVGSWERQPPTVSPEQLVHEFVAGLFDLARRNRELLLSLVAARTSAEEPLRDVARQVGERFGNALTAMYRVAVEEGAAHHFVGMDPPVTLAAVVGMVLGMVLLDDWVFPPGRRPGRDRQVREVATMILHGIAHRDPAT